MKILKQFARKDKRIKLISQENKGQSAARNIGLKMAKGQYVGFIDADDYVNDVFGIDLVYKSPSSKFNQDDIADSINVAWSQIGDVEPYALDTFENITRRFYKLITE